MFDEHRHRFLERPLERLDLRRRYHQILIREFSGFKELRPSIDPVLGHSWISLRWILSPGLSGTELHIHGFHIVIVDKSLLNEPF